jgi:hypothetical protein
MPYLKFNDKFYRDVDNFADHVLILALRLLGEKFIAKRFHFDKFLDKITNSVDVISLINDLTTAGVTFPPCFDTCAEGLYSGEADDADDTAKDVLALIAGLKRNF